jgi:hypothetical protein
MDLERLTDQELLVLARDTPRAFGVFYRRHVHAIHGTFGGASSRSRPHSI